MRDRGIRGYGWMALCVLAMAPVFLAGCGGGGATEGVAQAAPQAPSLHDDIETCGACHETIYAAWQKSRHAQAWKSETFRVASDNYRKEECLPCHAPDMVQRTGFGEKPMVRDGYRSDGVTCIVCHQDATSEEWKMHGPYEADSPAHETVQDDAYFTADVCASCHGHDAEFNQYHSWKEGTYGQQEFPCQACHMTQTEALLADAEPDHPLRWVGDHSFPGSHDEEFLKTAGTVKLKVEDGDLVVKVQNQAGHNFPGGAYRTAIVTISVDGVEVGKLEYSYENENQLESMETVTLRHELMDGAKQASARLTYYKYEVNEAGTGLRQSDFGIVIDESSLDL